MNIVYIGAFRLPDLDAAAPRVLNNAKAFRALGHNVRFISWGGTYRENHYCDDGKYRVQGFEYQISGDLPLDDSLKERFRSKLFRGKRSIRILNKLPKPNLIIIYNANNSFSKYMIKYCRRNNIKLANDINEWFSNNELHIMELLPNYINMTRTQYKIKNKIVISSFLDKYYSTSNNVLIPPLCDSDDSKWTDTIEDNRIKPYEGITLIYAGTPAKKDCLHPIVSAVNSLANEGLPIRFLILGTTRETYMKQYECFSHFLHQNIIFLGRVAQDLIPAYYKKADYMVLLREPSRKSMAGFPTKFSESFMSGVPVITNATSDLAKYVITGKTGFIVDGWDCDSLLRTLQEKVLVLKRNEIDYMKSCVIESRKYFDWHYYISDFKAFIQNLK